MSTTRNPLVSLMLAGGLVFGAAAAYAQGAPGAPDAAPQTMPSEQEGAQAAAPVSDEDVNKFVEAYTSVQTLNHEYAAKLQGAEDPEVATSLQQEAQTKMQEAITDAGLSLDEYQEIANLANQHPDLHERIISELTEE